MMRILIVVALALVASSASAQTRSVFIEDLTWPEIRDAQAAGKTAAIIFAGGLEQNGHHMALAKHNVIGKHVSGKIAERVGTALVFPVIPFSMNGDPLAKGGHMRWPGTVSLTSEVFLGVMRQVSESAAVNGFKHIFLMGDHGGGQAELRLAAEALDGEWRAKGVRVYYVSDLPGKAAQQINAYLAERKIAPGGHAGVAESAQVMFLDQGRTLMRPDAYRAAAAGPTDVTGASGDPSLATAEMGRVFLDYKIAAAADQIRQLLTQK